MAVKVPGNIDADPKNANWIRDIRKMREKEESQGVLKKLQDRRELKKKGGTRVPAIQLQKGE